MTNINKSYLLLAALLAAKTGTAEAKFTQNVCYDIVNCYSAYTEDDQDEADQYCCVERYGYTYGSTNFYNCHYVGALGVSSTYCDTSSGGGGGGTTTPSFSDYCNDTEFGTYSDQFSDCMAWKEDILSDAQACCKQVHSSNATYAQYCLAIWSGSMSCTSGSDCGPGQVFSGGSCRATEACDVGWYHPIAGTDYCAQCPSFDNARWNGKTWSDFTDIKGGDTTAGAQAGTIWGLATCYVPTSTAFSDPTGTYEFAWNCYHGS